MQRVLGTSLFGEQSSTRTVIGVNVRVDHVRDRKPFRLRKFDVRFDVALLRVDDGSLADRAATEDVCRAARIEIVERSENHDVTPIDETSTGRPRARHSTIPSSIRTAVKPFARSTFTASTANTQYGPRQYATTSRCFGSEVNRRLSSVTGIETAPGMCPARNSSTGRTSSTVTSP